MPEQRSFAPKPYDPATVLGLLGSLWPNYYGGNKPLLTLVRANLELHEQQRQNLEEAVACVSRVHVPLYHTERWVLLKLEQQQTYDAGFCFAKPRGLVSLPLLLNRMTDATLMLQEGIDYRIEPKSVTFEKDPFENAQIAQNEDIAYLWGVHGQFDYDYPYKHHGYVRQLRRAPDQSPAGYKRTINAVADCEVRETTMARLTAVLAAALDIPAADGQETVQMIATDRRGRFLVTTHNIYRIAEDAILSHPEGSQPHIGELLVEAFKISEIRGGKFPDGVTDVIVPAGMADGAPQTIPATSLDVVSCILIQMNQSLILDSDALLALIRRVLPPQTGVVFAAL